MLQEQRFTAGDMIFKEGDPSDSAYVIHVGKVEILKKAAHGEIRLATMGQGETFGEMGLFDDAPRSASARAVEDTIVDTISRDELRALMGQCPERIIPIIEAVFDRLRSTNQRVSKSEQATVLLESDIQLISITPDCEALHSAFSNIDVPVAQLPFRVGGYPIDFERKVGQDKNHLSLPSEGPPLTISRNHFEIAIEDGGVYFIDRGSRFGSVVDGTRIGRGRGKYKLPLQMGENKVQLGGKYSPYQLAIFCN